jgi:hypothetical protein
MESTADELSSLLGNFSLSEEEKSDVQIQTQNVHLLVEKGKSCLVGRVIADRFVTKENLRPTLMRAWRPIGNLSFRSLGENTFLFVFKYEWEKARILEGRPWVFDGHLVSLLEFDGFTTTSKLAFEKAAFWVRMYNLPLACMGKEVGYQIGGSVGEVEDVEVDEDGMGWGEFLRVRILLDLSKPLPRGRMITLNHKMVWIAFQYV